MLDIWHIAYSKHKVFNKRGYTQVKHDLSVCSESERVVSAYLAETVFSSGGWGGGWLWKHNQQKWLKYLSETFVSNVILTLKNMKNT